MGLLKALLQVGGKLGVIRVVAPSTQDGDRRIATRRVSLADLATEIRDGEVKALAEQPAEMSIDFARIFEAAGVRVPAHGCTVERLEQLLRSKDFEGLDRRACQEGVAAWLDDQRGDASDLVQDAVARDKALDAFAEFVRHKIDERATLRERRLAEVEANLQALRQEQQRLREENKAEAEGWKQWKRKKIEQERNMAWALSFVLDKPIVSIDHED